MLHLFEQLPPENQLPLQSAMPKTQLCSIPPHLSSPSTPKRPSQCQQKNPSTDKKSVSSKCNSQINDKDTGMSTQFQRSENQTKSSRQPQFNAAAIDKFPKDLFSVLQSILVSIINGDKTFDTNALIDPGSTRTYTVDHISSFLRLKTGQ